jgi:hypothetical protein
MRGNSVELPWRYAGRGLRESLRRLGPRESEGARRSGVELAFYRLLVPAADSRLYNPDKTINYSKTPQSARYAFTFWASRARTIVKNIKDYVKWAEDYYKQHKFRCNMPLGSYFIRKDRSSLLSYSWDGDIISLDPIHAPSDREPDAWPAFLKAFNGMGVRA